MSRSSFNRQRRRFLRQTLAGLGTLALTPDPFGRSLIRSAFGATNPPKRRLINIQAGGGWDVHWFHSTFRRADAAGFTRYHEQQTNSDTGEIIDSHHRGYTVRFDQDNGFLQHPRRSNVFLGLGMKYLFGDSRGRNLLSNDMLIWRGIQKDSDHGIGNRLFLHGSLTSYALTYSSLISEHLARTNPLPLHYVQLTASPEDFSSNWALAKGFQVPLNIDGYYAWRDLTRPSTSDFGQKSVLDAIEATVSSLSRSSKGAFKLDESQQIVDAFQNGFTSAVNVGTSRYAESLEFMYIWKDYFLKAVRAVQGMYDAGSVFGQNNLSKPLHSSEETQTQMITADPALLESSNPYFNLATMGGGNANTQLGAAMSYGAGIDDSYPSQSHTIPSASELQSRQGQILDFFVAWEARRAEPDMPYWWNVIMEAAFRYALADFLVRKDLSAVVDLPTPTSDAHEEGDRHTVLLMITFALYRKLLDNLRDVPDRSTGQPLMSSTTVVMWSELDRNVVYSHLGSITPHRGTNHAPSTSAILAGAGVPGGRVVGEIKAGPAGPRPDTGGWNSFGYEDPLPINYDTGQADLGGKYANSKSVFPTMLKIFGVEVPQNQVTEAIAIKSLIKS